jgi:hypothetical protein
LMIYVSIIEQAMNDSFKNKIIYKIELNIKCCSIYKSIFI